VQRKSEEHADQRKAEEEAEVGFGRSVVKREEAVAQQLDAMGEGVVEHPFAVLGWNEAERKNHPGQEVQRGKQDADDVAQFRDQLDHHRQDQPQAQTAQQHADEAEHRRQGVEGDDGVAKQPRPRQQQNCDDDAEEGFERRAHQHRIDRQHLAVAEQGLIGVDRAHAALEHVARGEETDQAHKKPHHCVRTRHDAHADEGEQHQDEQHVDDGLEQHPRPGCARGSDARDGLTKKEGLPDGQSDRERGTTGSGHEQQEAHQAQSENARMLTPQVVPRRAFLGTAQHFYNITLQPYYLSNRHLRYLS